MGNCKSKGKGGKKGRAWFVVAFVAVVALLACFDAGPAMAAGTCQIVNGQWVCSANGRRAPVARITTAPVRGTVRVARRVARPVFRLGAGICRLGGRCN